jgi:hypothetical protein
MEVFDVAAVQQVEAAVRQHHAVALRGGSLAEAKHLVESED